jgi:hypothetical protein
MQTAASTFIFIEHESDLRQIAIDEIDRNRIHWSMKEDKMLQVFGPEYLIEMTRLFKMKSGRHLPYFAPEMHETNEFENMPGPIKQIRDLEISDLYVEKKLVEILEEKMLMKKNLGSLRKCLF